MSTEEERFAQLRQMGFVDVDKWAWGGFGSPPAKYQQQCLLDVLRHDPQAIGVRVEGS
jgi:hypothetical protein